jgi:hypothetical protein
MNQPQSGRRASASRPARLSLVEFALPASGAPETSPAARPVPVHAAKPVPVMRKEKQRSNKQRSKKIDKGRKKIMHEPLNEDKKIAASDLHPATDLNGAPPADNPLFHHFEDMTSVAAKAARDYRSWMLGQMKISMCAALDYANGLASVNSRIASATDPDTTEPARNAAAQSADKMTPTVAKVADEYRAKAFELMSANMSTTLEYAQRLVNVKTPTEFVELSTNHARKQFELIMKQTAELGSIAQKLATPDVESLTVGFRKAFGERK